MIEAVNASVANAQVMRVIAEETTSSQSLAANPARIQKAGVSAPYLSPHVRLTPNAKPIFVVRDINTGAQVKQFPTEAQIRAYQKAGQARAAAQAAAMGSDDVKVITPEQAEQMVRTSIEYKEERAAVQFKADYVAPQPKVETREAPAPTMVDQQA